MSTIPTVDEVLEDSEASLWLQMALTMALRRDCVAVANDAAMLALVLQTRADRIVRSTRTLMGLFQATSVREIDQRPR